MGNEKKTDPVVVVPSVPADPKGGGWLGQVVSAIVEKRITTEERVFLDAIKVHRAACGAWPYAVGLSDSGRGSLDITARTFTKEEISQITGPAGVLAPEGVYRIMMSHEIEGTETGKILVSIMELEAQLRARARAGVL